LCGVALTDGGKLAQLRIRVVTLGDLKQPRATPFYEHPPFVNASSRFCRVFLGEPNQSLRLFAWAPKKLTKN